MEHVGFGTMPIRAATLDRHCDDIASTHERIRDRLSWTTEKAAVLCSVLSECRSLGDSGNDLEFDAKFSCQGFVTIQRRIEPVRQVRHEPRLDDRGKANVRARRIEPCGFASRGNAPSCNT